MLTLAGTLDTLRPHLPAALVSDDAFVRARAAVNHLEADITNGVYFECRLHNQAPRVDLVLLLHAAGGALLAANGGGARPGSVRERAAQRTVISFCRRWTAPGSPLRNLIDHAWIEYDVDHDPPGDGAARSASGVFASLRTSYGLAHAAPVLGPSALEVVEALTGRRASEVVRECLSACIERLPVEARIVHVGLMSGRSEPTVRICIAKLPVEGIEHLLAATAGIGGSDIADITRMASLPDGAGEPLYISMLHLDIDERRGFVPRIGLERQFARACQISGQIGAAERGFLDTLTARGLCVGDKRDALLQWPGRSVAMMPHELWWSLIDRRVNHVKFVYAPDSGLETKGYLFAKHRPRRRPC